MIDWQTASYIAGTVGSAVAAIDKMYRGYADFFEDRKSAPNVAAPPPYFSIQNSVDDGAIIAKSLHTGQVYQKVTYDELRAKLNLTDRAHIEMLSQALDNYGRQWDSALLAKSMSSGMDVGRYEAQLEYLAKEIASPLLRVLQIVETLGLYLDDHYIAARDIASKYISTAASA